MPVTIDDLSAPNATVTGERGRGMGGRGGEKGMLCVARGSGLRHASTPTRAAITYSASYSIILVGLRQRVATNRMVPTSGVPRSMSRSLPCAQPRLSFAACKAVLTSTSKQVTARAAATHGCNRKWTCRVNCRSQTWRACGPCEITSFCAGCHNRIRHIDTSADD